MLSGVKKLDVHRSSIHDADIAVVVIDLFLMVITIEANQVYGKRVGLAVVVSFHHRLLL